MPVLLGLMDLAKTARDCAAPDVVTTPELTRRVMEPDQGSGYRDGCNVRWGGLLQPPAVPSPCPERKNQEILRTGVRESTCSQTAQDLVSLYTIEALAHDRRVAIRLRCLKEAVAAVSVACLDGRSLAATLAG
jgi:hypothetical protein